LFIFEIWDLYDQQECSTYVHKLKPMSQPFATSEFWSSLEAHGPNRIQLQDPKI